MLVLNWNTWFYCGALFRSAAELPEGLQRHNLERLYKVIGDYFLQFWGLSFHHPCFSEALIPLKERSYLASSSFLTEINVMCRTNAQQLWSLLSMTLSTHSTARKITEVVEEEEKNEEEEEERTGEGKIWGVSTGRNGEEEKVSLSGWAFFIWGSADHGG